MSSANATSGLRLSGRYTSARKVVISKSRVVLPAADGPEPLALEPHLVGPVPHETLHLVRPGVGGDVDVAFLVRAQVEEGIPDAPADEEALVAGRYQPPGQLLGG